MQDLAKKVVKRLQDAGHIAYFAGGWVRDFLMRHPSDDIDIATSASTTEVQKLFKKTIPVGVAFGIVIVVEGGVQFEVATFRKDRGYTDGRRPTGIDPADPEEDAKRRDFTINGLFYDPIAEKLFDFVGGVEDIKRGIIRAIGDPHERFAEDRLRMMRAVRYSSRFQFPIDPKTQAAILAHSNELTTAVAMERVWQEFKKMSQFGHFDRSLIELHRLNLLPTIFPSLKGVPIEEVQQRVQYIPAFPKKAPTFGELLELFPTHSLEEMEALIEYLKLSNEESHFTHFYHRSKQLFSMPKSWLEKLEKIEWAEFYAHPSCEICLEMIAARLPNKALFLEEHKERQESLKEDIDRIRTKNPYLRADDLKNAGILPGEKMGQLLKEALRIAVNEGIKEKSLLIKKLKETPLWPYSHPDRA